MAVSVRVEDAKSKLSVPLLKKKSIKNVGRDAPAERPRLQLKPRSVDNVKEQSAQTPSSSSKANPFGAAKPVDTDSALKRIEEKLSKTTIQEPKTKAKSGQEP